MVVFRQIARYNESVTKRSTDASGICEPNGEMQDLLHLFRQSNRKVRLSNEKADTIGNVTRWYSVALPDGIRMGYGSSAGGRDTKSL